MIGLGIGVRTNAAASLGMKVIGYDAYLSVKNALHISDKVQVVEKLDDMLPECDFLTVHVHANDATNGMINGDTFAKMKDGSVLLNYARGLHRGYTVSERSSGKRQTQKIRDGLPK